jgi:hydrogenase-4 component B
MDLIHVFILLIIAAVIIIPFLNNKGRAIAVLTTILLSSIIASVPAVSSLMGKSTEIILNGGFAFGPIPVRIDALSGWFILIICLISLTGCLYGISYMKMYREQNSNIGLHAVSFILLFASMIAITVVQNSLAFLMLWEIMTLSAFIAVIFEHNKPDTIKAGMNFFIQSHISILLLFIGFIWIASKTGSYDFVTITQYTGLHDGPSSLALFILFAAGFSIKAGFVPFHSWLPYAHPAAPAHISGIMSGVMIKIGIFGILRMITLIRTDFLIIGYIILSISVISGLYGVMLAIIQHNLKRLLAYHSIENIGIIGIGIGLGCVGLGTSNQYLSLLGFTGALLHTLNHSLFKSLLFFTAGNVYQATHTLDIERLGGLVKKMPHTTLLFILSALAICGLPPFNGFISEFVIYNGLYIWMQNAQLVDLVIIIFTVMGLVLIGGLAILCFTKAAGVVFLGTPRHKFDHEPKEVPVKQIIPLYVIAAFIIGIGLSPQTFVGILLQPVSALTGNNPGLITPIHEQTMGIMQKISLAAAGFIALVFLILAIKKFATRKKSIRTDSTWGCGYTAPTSKIQYTGSSYARTYSKLFSSILLSFKTTKEVTGIFPEEAHYETKPYDKVEKWLIDMPLKSYKSFMNRFLFFQNGKLQFYILYGIVFIVAVILLPVVYNTLIAFIQFLNQF